MESFLKYVAEDIIKDNTKGNHIDLSDVVVVFPNKRASLFLNEELIKQAGQSIWCPTYITISDLFRRHSQLQVADPIKLICDLHKTFTECTGIDETLDHFYGWGQLLLADFDDIDKNMGDAKQIFLNLANLHELDDDSYLDEEKRKILKKFFSNFTDDHSSELKKRFIELWNHLYDIYTRFNERLREQGLSYEGALYRQVAENKDIQFEHGTYLFVGFNMMQTVERKLYEQLKSKAICHFYWDYDKYYVDDKKKQRSIDRKSWNIKNEAGHYISQYLCDYDNKLQDHPHHDDIYDNMSHDKDISYLSAPTENIQARYIHDWLLENDRYKAGRKTAIVLGDESLLPTVIHSLPAEVEQVNITLGYPLQQTPFYSMVQQLIHLQTLGHPTGSGTYRLHYASKILRHPYVRFISAHSNELLKELETKKIFYPSREQLSMGDDEGLALLFKDLEATENENLAIADYLVDILKMIGSHTNNKAQETLDGIGDESAEGAKSFHDPLFQESLFRTYTLVNRLRGLIASGDLVVDKITMERLILQLFQSTTVPFHGEPAIGVQIMGVLETRNLDFDHILVLSCNEGNLPKGVNDASFIPYSIRKAHGLTTIDNKVAIFGYYFLRMIQRAQDITLTYNNSTEDGHTGEMSRFMLQLLVESPHHILRKSLVAGQDIEQSENEIVEKTPEIMEILNRPHLITPTFLNTYLRCPKRFYYKYVEGLQEPDELEEEIDNRIFGNIFHRAAQLFYLRMANPANVKTNEKGELELLRPISVMKGDIEAGLKDSSLVGRLVDEAFREELFKVKENGFLPQYNGLQLINRAVIISYLKQLLKIDQELAPFTILGLELKVAAKFEFDTPEGKKILPMGGFIDRLDAVAANGNPDLSNLAERIRVIDYKTGRATTSFPKSVEEIFDSKMLKKHTDYYLQAMLYSLIVKHDKKLNNAQDPVSPALLFIQQAGTKGYDPTLKFGKDLIVDAATYEEEFKQGLNQLVSNILDSSIPFAPTEEMQRCETCPYASLCR